MLVVLGVLGRVCLIGIVLCWLVVCVRVVCGCCCCVGGFCVSVGVCCVVF